MTARLTLVLCAATAAFAQNPPSPHLEFEVASIRPSTPGDQSVHIGVRVDGAQVHIAGYSLKDYIRLAYRVKDYQVEGPEWISSQRFDVDAKLPPGATRDQVNDMLQTLLHDRFEVKFHRTQKEFPVYALVAAKGGAKLTESKVDAETAAALAKPPNSADATGSAAGVFLTLGPGSVFNFSEDKLEIKRLSMARFAELLSRFVDRPVVDMTNLPNYYELSFPVSSEDYRSMLIRSAMSAGVDLPPQAVQMAGQGIADSLAAGLAANGLKLESRKAPLDVLVVDSANRSPSEN